MQLILETETTIGIQKDMSTNEETLSETAVVVNGDIEDLNKTKCISNKENIGEDNIIIGNIGSPNPILEETTDNVKANIPINTEDFNLDNEKESLPDNLASDNEQTKESQENGLEEVVEDDPSKNIDCLFEQTEQANVIENDSFSINENLSSIGIENKDDAYKKIVNDSNDDHENNSEPCMSNENDQGLCLPNKNDSEPCSLIEKMEQRTDDILKNIDESMNKNSSIVNGDEILEEENETETKLLENSEPQAEHDINVKADAVSKEIKDIGKDKTDIIRDNVIDSDMEKKSDEPAKPHDEKIMEVDESVSPKKDLKSELKDTVDEDRKGLGEDESYNNVLSNTCMNNIEEPALFEKSDPEQINESHQTESVKTDEEIIKGKIYENIDSNKELEESNPNEDMEVDEMINEPDKSERYSSDNVHSNILQESNNDMAVEEVTEVSKDKLINITDISHPDKMLNELLPNETRKDNDVDNPIVNTGKDELDDLSEVEKSIPSLIKDNNMDIEEVKDFVEDITNDSSANQNTEESAMVGLIDTINVEEVKGFQENKNDSVTISDIHKENEKSLTIDLKDEVDVEEVKNAEESKSNVTEEITTPEIVSTIPVNVKNKPIISKLSNTLDILSDDEEEPPKENPPNKERESFSKDSSEKLCINIEDDDDIMVIDEEVSTKPEANQNRTLKEERSGPTKSSSKLETNTDKKTHDEKLKENDDLFSTKIEENDSVPAIPALESNVEIDISEKHVEDKPEKLQLPLLPDDFLKTAKKSIADMTRDELEEFCVLKIVESIVDRSNLSEFKTKLKNMAQGIDEYRKKAMMLIKQNRDLQVVLKSVMEEQKKVTDLPITPLKITRSVGMQVLMTDKTTVRRKGGPVGQQQQSPNVNNPNLFNRQNTRNPTPPSPRPQKQIATNPIPVPRLVPANVSTNNPALKSPSTVPQTVHITVPAKANASIPNGVKIPSNAQKVGEKRQLNRAQSVTVDLTDDEPPAKINTRNSPAAPVRLVSPQNLMQTKQPFSPAVNSPRKVYIPISTPQNQSLRPGQTIMLKTVPQGMRPRVPTPQMTRMTSAPVRMNRVTSGSGRHPAALPDAMKQYQPPNWKALPPPPDLRLSKVENGIVISWKIEGYQEDSYEEIASYQLYAYQETSSPPSTALWKKIGDVKALPLPMACTLTQFMAGFKYYFAVRAVDVKSRLGPFSLPGSILLLNKL